MLVTIDTDQLVRDAATLQMDNWLMNDKSCIVDALQKQLCNEAGVPRMQDIVVQVRQQVKEYKKLTMWRD